MAAALAEAPRAAKVLGILGLVPFLASALGAWILPPPYNYLAAQAGFFYAPVILTFLGAVHWGHSMAQGAEAMTLAPLGLAVLPALVSWVALLSHPIPGLILMTASFAALYLADARRVKDGRFPRWYRGLRRPLTAIVLLCLLTLLAFSYRQMRP
jgi:hypothetical protein